MTLPLRDLHLPEPIGWWPLAPGWWLLILLAFLAMAYGLVKAYRRRQRNAARRYALRELARYEAAFREHQDPVTLGKQLSQLLRRGMLAYAPRAEIAGLTGEAWLRWLDRGMPQPYFSAEGGKNLLQLPYRSPQDDIADIDIDGLLAAVRTRLRVPVEDSA